MAPEERLRVVGRHPAQFGGGAVGVPGARVDGGEHAVPQAGPGPGGADLLRDDGRLGAHGRRGGREAEQPPGLQGQQAGQGVGGRDGVEDGVVAVGLGVAHAARLLHQGHMTGIGAVLLVPREHQMLDEVGGAVAAGRVVVAARGHGERHGDEPASRQLLGDQPQAGVEARLAVRFRRHGSGR